MSGALCGMRRRAGSTCMPCRVRPRAPCLLMPAWGRGNCLGASLVTLAPGGGPTQPERFASRGPFPIHPAGTSPRQAGSPLCLRAPSQPDWTPPNGAAHRAALLLLAQAPRACACRQSTTTPQCIAPCPTGAALPGLVPPSQGGRLSPSSRSSRAGTDVPAAASPRPGGIPTCYGRAPAPPTRWWRRGPWLGEEGGMRRWAEVAGGAWGWSPFVRVEGWLW